MRTFLGLSNTARILVLACVVSFTGAYAWQTHKVRQLEDQMALSNDSLHAALVKRTRVVADTIAVQLAAAGHVIYRTIEKVRVDTLMLHPMTPAETVLAVGQLPALAIQHDSLQRQCSAFVSKCDEFRKATLVERGATDARIAGLERIAAQKRRRTWVGAPDLVGGAGGCATSLGLQPCVFVGIGGRLGW